MRRIGIAVVLLTLASCSTTLKQRAVAGLSASETALELSHDAERLLCAPTADQSKGIAHCDGTEAKAIGLTDAVHAKAAAFYAQAFAVQRKAAEAAKLWRSGDPVPSDVASYRAALNDILTALQSIVPQQAVAMIQLQRAIAAAADLATTLGVK